MPLDKQAIEKLLRDADRMKTARSNFESYWQDAAELIHPIEDTFTRKGSAGENKRERIFDGTGEQANQQLAAGLFSLLTNPTQPFFEISTSDKPAREDWNVANWLQQVTDIMNFEIQLPASNFTAALSEGYLEYGAFGNCTILVSEHPRKKQTLYFEASPLTDTLFAEGSASLIDRVVRCYYKDAEDVIDQFGADSVSQDVLKMSKQPTDQEKVEIMHVIRPVNERLGFFPPRGFEGFRYVGYYIEKKTKHLLKESGYYEQPFAVARFYKAANETYGRGPGFAALSDVKMLQEIYQTTLSGAQKMVDPAVMMPDDGFLSVLDMRPGAINYYQAGLDGRIEPIQTGAQPILGEDMAAGVRKRILDAFYVTQLQLNIGPQMTATEVMERVEQQMRMLGPLTGRLQTELLSTLIQRCFGILLRMGKFPPVPEALVRRGNVLRIVYTTPMARAQDQLQANSLTRTLQVIEPLVAMNPAMMDNFNTDQIAQGIGEVFSVSKRFFNSPEQRSQIRDQRAKQQQQQAMLEQAQALQAGGQGVASLAQAARDGGV